uniref:polynucleotide adenylyltransferase n=1 Tax=Timema cristinae TaxID=61476 RepID=A0A7R9CQJ3_TIMCR|nr:unnamed protein product [Timema cristinae]
MTSQVVLSLSRRDFASPPVVGATISADVGVPSAPIGRDVTACSPFHPKLNRCLATILGRQRSACQSRSSSLRETQGTAFTCLLNFLAFLMSLRREVVRKEPSPGGIIQVAFLKSSQRGRKPKFFPANSTTPAPPIGATLPPRPLLSVRLYRPGASYRYDSTAPAPPIGHSFNSATLNSPDRDLNLGLPVLSSRAQHDKRCGSLEVTEERRRRVTMMETMRDVKTDASSQQHQRLAVLSYEQVRRLNDVMDEVVSIHGRGNFPTLEVRLRDLVTLVRAKLEAETSAGGGGMQVRDIRLNGGAASHVLTSSASPQNYNDLDLIFGIELSTPRNFDRIKNAVLASLFDLLPEGVSKKRITSCSMKEAYVGKMVKVNHDGDRWSLISLGNSRGHRNVELKFVDTMRRQFEFSVDSFQIVLDSLLLFYDCSKLPIGENFYPTVVGESVYGDFQEALYHLHKKLIATRHPEEIRGGGLLKYCYLLVKCYRPAKPDYIKNLERYMCSRFFIDFSDIGQQRAKLENYLWNHFCQPEEDESLKYQYLMLLHEVVEESTVCLMGHERRQTLSLIEELAYHVLCQEQQRLLAKHHRQHPQPGPTTLLYANGVYYAPIIPTTTAPLAPIACFPCTCSAGATTTTWMACSS